MRAFVCGIIQGSCEGLKIHDQGYRKVIHDLLKRYMPDLDVYCPVSLHPRSPEYADQQAIEVLEQSVEEAKSSDIVIAYLPEASMGSAIEMWEARRAGKKVVTITPLKSNWVVRYTSHLILDSIEELEQALRARKIQHLLQNV